MINPVVLVRSIVVPHTAFQSGLDLLERHLKLCQESGESSLVLITGEPGTGKSFLFKTLLGGPKYKKYRDKEGLVVPAPVVGLPAKPSPKSMLEEILTMYEVSDTARSTEGQLRRRTVTLIRECKTRIMVIEDFQQLVDRRTAKVWHHCDDLMKKIHDDSKCLFVLSGLPHCSKVIESNKQLATRVRGHIELPRFNWRDPKQRSEFVGCLDGFHETISKHYRLPPIFEAEWAYRMYCATGGLMRLLANLLKELLSVAGEKQISLSDFAKAHESLRFRAPSYEINVRPFDPKFLVSATEDVMSKVDQIGREPEEAAEIRRSRKAKAA